jgi:lantibiotic biosynthesis protein
VPLERAIPLSELAVSVRNGRFRLRWRKSGAELMVRAGHMLTNFHAPQVCRFLDDIVEDGIAQLSGFDWGPAFSYPFLPRIVYERCILSPARWRIDLALRDAELGANQSEFPEKLARFRNSWKVPRHIYLAIGDNRLLLDLDVPDQAEALRVELAKLRSAASIVLHEALPGPEHAWIKGPEGRHVAELVVPLVLRPFMKEPVAQPADEGQASNTDVTAASAVNRLRPPGSDWLFVKLYCPAVLEEELLTGPVRDFCHEMSRTRFTDGWFFVRYADPDPHIRLRFRGDPNRLLTELLPEICAWGGELINEGMCQRFAFDTYDREIERYGGAAGMAAVEAIFTADSPAVVDLLAVLRKASDLDRVTLAVASIDDLLSAIGLDGTQRHGWYKGRVKAPHLSGQDFRERKSVLRSLFGNANGIATVEHGAEIGRIFAERRHSLASIAERFAMLTDRGSVGKNRDVILQSVVHMHCNRLAGADRGIEERALGLLLRVCQSLKEAPIASPRALDADHS